MKIQSANIVKEGRNSFTVLYTTTENKTGHAGFFNSKKAAENWIADKSK